MNRRKALLGLGVASASLALNPAAWASRAVTKAAPKPFRLSATQDALLDELERRAAAFFYEQADQRTGQVRDRARTEGKETRRIGSIAATGFGLTGLCIADQRGYLPAPAIRERVHATLDWHLHHAAHEHGFLFHFMDIESGQRLWNCEISSIDTALLLCGVLTCRAHFTGGGIEAEIREMASALYDRVDWTWMLEGELTYSMGWKPESGFLSSRWSTYSELMMLYLLGMGSRTYPAPPRTWLAFARPYINYQGLHYISDLAPLFIHQFSHAWFDFCEKHDRYTNYFQNSVVATRAHKVFCIDRGEPYTERYWGITASDSQHGYTAWGGPPLMGRVDGSVVPCAAAGSLPFLPAECLEVLSSLCATYPQAFGRYGFVDAFHPQANWYDTDVLGIDQGIGMLMAENLRTSFVWNTFKRNPEVDSAMRLAGFTA